MLRLLIISTMLELHDLYREMSTVHFLVISPMLELHDVYREMSIVH